jgi:hypothetical protein
MTQQFSQNSIALLKEMAQWYRQNRGKFGTIFRRNPRLQNRSGGGGSSAVSATSMFATVLVAPTNPDPEAGEGTEEYAGISKYVCRLLATEYAAFVVDKDPAYILDEIVRWPDTVIGRAYKCTAEVLQNTGLTPPENSAEWELYPEIEIQYALGFSETSSYNLKNFSPRLQVGSVVEIISRQVVVGEETITRYYLRGILTYTGTPEEASIRQTGSNGQITSSVYL